MCRCVGTHSMADICRWQNNLKELILPSLTSLGLWVSHLHPLSHLTSPNSTIFKAAVRKILRSPFVHLLNKCLMFGYHASDCEIHSQTVIKNFRKSSFLSIESLAVVEQCLIDVLQKSRVNKMAIYYKRWFSLHHWQHRQWLDAHKKGWEPGSCSVHRLCLTRWGTEVMETPTGPLVFSSQWKGKVVGLHWQHWWQ